MFRFIGGFIRFIIVTLLLIATLAAAVFFGGKYLAFSNETTMDDITYSYVRIVQQTEVQSCNKSAEVAVILPVVNGYRVSSIKESAFKDCKLLKNLYIPKSVTGIEGGAFVGCDSLTDIYFEGSEELWLLHGFDKTIPEGVTVHFDYKL